VSEKTERKRTDDCFVGEREKDENEGDAGLVSTNIKRREFEALLRLGFRVYFLRHHRTLESSPSSSPPRLSCASPSSNLPRPSTTMNSYSDFPSLPSGERVVRVDLFKIYYFRVILPFITIIIIVVF